MNIDTRPGSNRMHGAVLAIALVLLTVLSLLALGASQLTRTQGAAAVSIQNRAIAFQAAEGTLRSAERLLNDWLQDNAQTTCDTPPCRIYPRNSLGDLGRQPISWWNEYAWVYTEDRDWKPASDHPRPDALQALFVIEQMEDVADSLAIVPSGPPSGRAYYRVTAIAPYNERNAVILQSTFSRRFN
jgi:type IV pilus assembly protein PilX